MLAPLLATLAGLARSAEFDAYEQERRLVLAVPEVPEHGVPWVVQFPGSTPLETRELLDRLAEPALTRSFRERQDRALAQGVGAAVVAQGMIFGGLALSAKTAFDFPTQDDVWVPVGLGVTVTGIALDLVVLQHFRRFARRERHPALWLDLPEASRYVERYNARSAWGR